MVIVIIIIIITTILIIIVLAQPEMTFVFLFLVELALLFFFLVVLGSPGFNCLLQTSLHFPPRWFPFSFWINHLIAKSYRFPFKAQSHSNFLHRLHRFIMKVIPVAANAIYICRFSVSTVTLLRKHIWKVLNRNFL